MEEATSARVLRVVDKVKSRGAAQSARRVRGIFHPIFEHAIDRLLVQSNPVDRIKPSAIASVSQRDRALTLDEIGSFLSALDAES